MTQGGEAVATQSRQEGEGPPFAEGRFGDEALTSGASAVGARHLFSPCICWSGLSLNRWGCEVHALQTNS